jgi:phosphodiesterase/alkaline phosphatase D-like protein
LIAFRHGVASADPLPDGVLLWTRVTTDAAGPVAVDWWLGEGPQAAAALARGTAEASPERDFTVHVDVGGLEPGTTYWYGFGAGDVASPVGRTRTAPVGPLRVGLASCANWSCGFFNAYANLAARDLDLVVHVGDYLYENDLMRLSRRAVRKTPWWGGVGGWFFPTSPRGRASPWRTTAPATPSTARTPTCRPSTPATRWWPRGTTTS